MSSRLLFSDFATPYDIMVGFWAKQSITYDSKGEYVDSEPALVAVYWEKPSKRIHFREDPQKTTDSSKSYAHKTVVAQLTRLDFDLKVKGKNATGGSQGVTVTGVEARPDIYHFHLKVQGGNWYNNHYFISSNERHIMGPFVPGGGGGEIEYIVAQTLTRISFEVPDEYKRPLSGVVQKKKSR
jgi:hypothetical protein